MSPQQPNAKLKAVVMVADTIFYLGVAFGIGMARHFRRQMTLLWVPIVGFVAVHLVLHAEARYRIPVVPLLCVLFGGVGLLWQNRAAFQQDKPAFHLALLLAGLIAGIYILTTFLYLSGAV